MKAEELHPIFKECCLKTSTRYAMDHPFSQGGYWCATDGRILVRQKTDEPDSDGKYPDTASVWRADELYEPEPMPLDVTAECKNCDGSETQKCEECQGTGECVCRCDHEHECGYCDGRGSWDCRCNLGKHYDAGTYLIAGGFVRLILKHGGLIFQPKDKAANKTPFRFTIGDSIEGLVMPMEKEKT